MSPPPTSLEGRAQVARDHALLLRGDPRAAVITALRTRSVHAREILAEIAWPGRTPMDIDTWAGSAHQPDGGWPRLPPDADPAGLAGLAQVEAVQTGEVAERRLARAMLESIVQDGRLDEVPARAVELLQQLRLVDGDAQAVLADLPDPRLRAQVRSALTADLANPFLGTGQDEAAWLELFSKALIGPRAAPFALAPSAGSHDGEPDSPLDRVRAPLAKPVAGGATITVLMSAYRPGPALRSAVGSVLRQTWADWELLVIDDASGPEHAPLLEEVEALDPRITVIHKAINGGTYRARNTGLRLATGEFVVVLDSDDVWHPQALELGVAPLLRRPGLLATRHQGVRTTEALQLTRPGYKLRSICGTSLLFRVRPVLERIGFFDPTSKGADTEYVRRIAAAFGDRVLDIRQTLTLIRSGQTLSSSEFSHGWRHPARHAYKGAYGRWHEAIRAGRTDPFLDPDAPRRFPEPRRWAKPEHPVLSPADHLDVCFAGDWRRYGGPQRSMLEEIRAARDAGLRVGIMHLEAFRFMTTEDLPLCAPVMELVTNGSVERLHLDDDVDIDVLLIRYPPVLQHPPRVERPVRAREVLIVANQAPMEPDGSDQRYAVADVTARTLELFGREPWWVPQGPMIRQVLLEQDPQLRVTPWDNTGLIDVDAWSVRGRRSPGADGAPVVVGRYSRDNPIKFPPTFEQVLRGYSFPDGYRVRMMGASNTVTRLAREGGYAGERERPTLPQGWVMLRHRAVEVTDFLGDLDFFLYLDNPQMREAFGRTLLEAAASGVLTIAHPRHRATFGEAMDYAEVGEAQQLIARYVADPGAYHERVERAQRSVREQFGADRFVAKLRSFGALPAPVPASANRDASGISVSATSTRHPAGPVSVLASSQHPAGQQPGVLSVPVRSAADAERADQLVLVHADGADAQAAQALREAWTLAGPAARHEAVLEALPAPVLAVLAVRDGLALLLARPEVAVSGPAGSDQAPGLVELSGLTVPAGWQARAWRVSGDPVPAYSSEGIRSGWPASVRV